jgi:hypothetical protein
VGERKVDIDFRCIVEEREQSVVRRSKVIQPIDQDASSSLGAAAASRRDDV